MVEVADEEVVREKDDQQHSACRRQTGMEHSRLYSLRLPAVLGQNFMI